MTRAHIFLEVLCNREISSGFFFKDHAHVLLNDKLYYVLNSIQYVLPNYLILLY